MMHWFRTSRINDSNQKIKPRAMVAHSTVFFVVFIVLHQTDSVFGCTVTPSAAAVIAGNSISVACRSTSEETVTVWKRPNGNTIVYLAQYGKQNRSVADGYSVDESNLSEIILILINASTVYADKYECTCLNLPDTFSSDSTNITVIDSEPQFVAVDGVSLSSDDPVSVMCSLKLAGNASVLMQIANSDGNVYEELQRISKNVSQQFNLYYNTSSAIEKMYFCNISLVNYGNVQQTAIFNRSLARTVQFSARSVSISPENPEHCQNGGLCKKNSVINCTASGSPEPKYNFTIFDQNGTLVGFLPNQQKYKTDSVGQKVIQCTAFNVINGSVYSNSINFTTNVTEADVGRESGGSSNVPLIVGLVVGLGGGLLILIIILIFIYYNRQKRRTACCNLEQSSEAKPEDAIETKDVTKGNKGNNTNTYGQTNLAETSGDERVLVDNPLYSGARGGVAYTAAIDPSAPVFLYRNHRFPQPDHVTMYHLRTAASVPVAQYGHQFSQFQPGYFYARQHY